MKTKLLTFLVCLMMLFSLNSWVVNGYATTQDDIYAETEVDVVRSNVSFDVIIQYGTPYYRDGALLYYLYRDIYYYPFYYNNYWYVRAYRRPFTHFDHRPYFRPHRYDYRFSPGSYRGFYRPNNPNSHYRPITPNRGNNDRYHRPHGSRPTIKPNNPYKPNSGRVTPKSRSNRQVITPNRGGGSHTNGGKFGGSRSSGRR